MASPTGPSAPDPRAAQAVIEAHESRLRHPIHAVEREAHELHETVVDGESGATPAILAGAWIMLLIPIVAIVVGLALGVAYLVTRGDGSGGIATARSVSTDELTARRTGDDERDLTAIPSAKTLSVVVRQVTNGGTSMPAFSGTPTQEQINDVVALRLEFVGLGEPAPTSLRRRFSWPPSRSSQRRRA